MLDSVDTQLKVSKYCQQFYTLGSAMCMCRVELFQSMRAFLTGCHLCHFTMTDPPPHVGQCTLNQCSQDVDPVSQPLCHDSVVKAVLFQRSAHFRFLMRLVVRECRKVLTFRFNNSWYFSAARQTHLTSFCQSIHCNWW